MNYQRTTNEAQFSKFIFMLRRSKGSKFFSADEELRIENAIENAELKTSGEIRVFIESTCKTKVHIRTIEIFKLLKMHNTADRNGVLLYIAMSDRQFAVFGDAGIHKHLGFGFWEKQAKYLRDFFEQNEKVEGIVNVINNIGENMAVYFPDAGTNSNELPNSIAYGK